VIGLPPSDVGATHVTIACPLPAVAVTLAGASGMLMGTTEFDDLDSGDGPCAVIVWTVNVYLVPFVSRVTVAVSVEPSTYTDWPPGLAVTVYPVIGLPPSNVGATQDTITCPSPAATPSSVGLPAMAALTVTKKVPASREPESPVAVKVTMYASAFAYL
jgi:hypothetical protein